MWTCRVSTWRRCFASQRGYSTIPVVGIRTLNASCPVGRKEDSAIRSRSLRQLKKKRSTAAKRSREKRAKHNSRYGARPHTSQSASWRCEKAEIFTVSWRRDGGLFSGRSLRVKCYKELQVKRPAAVTSVPEDDVIQVKRVLNDAGGGYSDPQNVLLGGHIPRGSYAF